MDICNAHTVNYFPFFKHSDLDAVPIDDELYPVEKIIKKRKNKSKVGFNVKEPITPCLTATAIMS